MTFLSKTLRNFSLCLLIVQAGFATTVGITQIVDHPSLDAIRTGVIETLKASDPSITIVYENAQGNPSTAAQIAQKFAGQNLDAIVAITTPSAQTMASKITKTPVIFTAVSDPVAAKIIKDPQKPEANITGIMDTPPVAQQLDFILKHMPDLKRLGYLYNPGEVNSVVVLETLQELAKKQGLTIIPLAIMKTSDMTSIASTMPGVIDALFIGNDNLVVSALEPIIKTTLQYKIPFFTSDPDSVERGALSSYAYDQKDIGVQAGHMTLRILRGRKITETPVETALTLRENTNPKTAKKIGFVFR